VRRIGFGSWAAELRLPAALRAQLVAPLHPNAAPFTAPQLWQSDDTGLIPSAEPTTFELRVWLEDVLRPLLRESKGTSGARRSRIERAASALGLTVADVGGAGATAVAFGEASSVDGGLLLWPGQKANGPLVESLGGLSGISELAARLAARLHASALLIDGRTPRSRSLAAAARAVIALSAELPPALAVVSARDSEPTTLYLPYGARWRPPLTAAVTALGMAPRVREYLDDRTPSALRALFGQRPGGSFATLSVSRADRLLFSSAPLGAAERSLFTRLAIPVRAADLAQRLHATCDGPASAGPGSAWADAWVADAQRYVAERSPAVLAAMVANAAQEHATLEGVTDLLTADTFLVVSRPGVSAAVLLHRSTGMRKLVCGATPLEALGVADGPRVSALMVSKP
jgi:hypothetical protein